MTTPAAWALARDLLALSEQRERDAPTKRIQFNPVPPGSIRAGSATEAVLAWITAPARRNHWHTRGQILAGTNRSEKSVNWALLHLLQQGYIECVPDGTRNPHYRRYKALSRAGR